MRNSSVNILLVEDDEVDVRAVQRGFKSVRIVNPIYVAKDGLEALDILRGENGHERLPRPYMILLDLKMPRMDGLEFLEAIRADEELKSSIVFVLTTSDDDRDRTAAYDKSISGYLLKSKVADDFMNVLRMLDLFVLTVQFPPAE